MTSARAGLALALAVAIAGGAWLARSVSSPESTLLRSEAGAIWIKRDAAVEARHRTGSDGAVRFQRRFDLAAVPDRATLTLRAFRSWRVLVNGVVIAERNDATGWNRSVSLDLGAALRAGSNRIDVEVDNPRGPAALLAYASSLGIATGDGWSASRHGDPLRPAVPASMQPRLPLSDEFPSPGQSLLGALPFVIVLFFVGAAGSRWKTLQPAHLRWLLFAGWMLLCARNFVALPASVGFDVQHHLAYIVYLSKVGRIPLAGDGWQMFQSPLFYLLATPIHDAVAGRLTSSEFLVALRAIPMLCGLAQIELAYRAGRMVFPERRELQIVALVAGGLLPINLYSAQVISNEPLAGALAALAVVHALKLLTDREIDSPLAHAVGLGAVFGLALLAKVTPILLAPLLAAALVHRARSLGLGLVGSGTLVAAFSFTTAAVAGWYYLRNWIELGRPFVGGWDPARGIVWWQDPGYRVPGDFFRFGDALTRPVYASMSGFWDGLYSTLWLDGFMSGVAIASAAPWRSELVLSMALLSIPMTVALFVGAIGSWRGEAGPSRAAGRFAVAAIAIHWTAMAAVFLTVPTYSSIKATYSLGVLPCYALVIARGFQPLLANRIAWTVAAGFLASWAGVSFFGYLS